MEKRATCTRQSKEMATKNEVLTVGKDAGYGISRSGNGGRNAFVGNDPKNGDGTISAEAH